jgi:hypothetical protein
MHCSLDDAELESQDFEDLGKLIQRGVGTAIFKVRQAAQGDPGELGEVALTESEQFAPLPNLGAEFMRPHESNLEKAHSNAFPQS